MRINLDGSNSLDESLSEDDFDEEPKEKEINRQLSPQGPSEIELQKCAEVLNHSKSPIDDAEVGANFPPSFIWWNYGVLKWDCC